MVERKPKRWLLRFVVRTTIVVVTMVCFYIAILGLTRTTGRRAVAEHIRTVYADPPELHCSVPFLVDASPEGEATSFASIAAQIGGSYATPARRHYLWMFGPVVPLPEGFTKFVERLKSIRESWTAEEYMTPQRVHGGII